MTLFFLKSPLGDEPVIVEGHFSAPPARVFIAWTDPDEIKKWFGLGTGELESAAIDLRIGGAWRFDTGVTNGRRDILLGEYLDIEIGRRLVFSWVHERSLSDGRIEKTPKSQVTITFEPIAEGTFVKLIHASIKTGDGRLGVGEGWNTTFAKLKALFDRETKDKAS